VTDKNSAGQPSKAAAEKRTAEVAQETAAEEAAVEQRAGTDQTPERTDGAPERRAVDATVDPYPDYDSQDVEHLQAHAESRGVEINRDVEKAELIRVLREHDTQDGPGPKQDGATNPYASYDQMPLEELRRLADERDVELPAEFRKAHLVTELRAADSGAGPSLSGPQA